MINERNRNFAQLEDFLQYFKPLTPYGKDEKRINTFFCDGSILAEKYDRIEMMIRFIEKNGHRADRLEYHLSRIPRLSSSLLRGELRSEIFNIKKFLHNYRSIVMQLGKNEKDKFHFHYIPDFLLDRLGYLEGQEESFYIDDSYSEELSRIRQSIGQINDGLKKIKDGKLLEIMNLCSLDFRFRDFLVIDESELPPDSENLIYIEPWDNTSVKVKPSLGQEYYSLHNSARELLDREQKIEMDILEQLASDIEGEQENLNLAVEAVRMLDLSLSKARLAIKFHCTRPVIQQDGLMKFKGMRFIPLELLCNKKKVVYTSMTVSFDKPNIVINGSNMGGKTVVLRTILFAQMLAQMGFFVPAENFETQLFSSINLVGAVVEEGTRGLSSFGEEIMGLIRSNKEGKTLYLLDEFARTTNSREAYALSCALLESFSQNSAIQSFSSTHLDRLPEFENTSFWTMKGLDYEKYNQYFHSDFHGDLNERISLINSFMDYSLIHRSDNSIGRDALKIADILGLDAEILLLAEKYMKLQEK